MAADRETVRRAKDGDEGAFATLYSAHVTVVFRYVNSILRNPTSSEDVTAQTFLQAWQRLSQLRDEERFQSWLFRIAHNQAISETRRRPTTTLEDAPEPADPSPYSAQDLLLDGRVNASVVRRALLQLPENLREVLVLRFFAGLSHAEVAAQIGKSEQNARVMQFRALKQMRGLVEAEGVSIA